METIKNSKKEFNRKARQKYHYVCERCNEGFNKIEELREHRYICKKMKKDKYNKIKALTKSPNENESEVARSYLQKAKSREVDKYSKPTKHSYENALEPSEQKAIINAIDEYDSPKRLHHKALIFLMMKAGLRVSEALQFRREWFIKKDDHYIIKIPFEDKSIVNLKKLWRPKTPKGRREIPIYDLEVTSFLDVFLHSNKRIELNRQNAYKIIKKYGAQIDKVDLHPHALRSTFANYLVSLNVSVSTLKYLMGWAKLEVANNYISGTPQGAKHDFKNKLEENGRN
jgi:integrase